MGLLLKQFRPAGDGGIKKYEMETQPELADQELEEGLTELVDTTLRLEYELELAVKNKK